MYLIHVGQFYYSTIFTKFFTWLLRGQICGTILGEPLVQLDKQRIIGGYNVPPFCSITGIFKGYYGMAITHILLNHNTLTYHNDS